MRITDQYEELAPVYDLLIPDPENMLSFFLKQVQLFARPGEQVLEIGAGTGRLTVLIAQEGYAVTALDLSSRMLSVLSRKLERLPPEVSRRIRILVGDQRHMALGSRFNVVLVTGGTVQHCLSEEEYLCTLERINLHLDEGGALIFDMAEPPSELNDRPFKIAYEATTVGSRGGITVKSWDNCNYDPKSNVLETESCFELYDASFGQLIRQSFHFAYSFPSLELILKWLRQSGFELIETVPDYGIATVVGRHLVFIARKKTVVNDATI